MMKKISGEKEKLEIAKMSKEIMERIYYEPEIQELINSTFREELRAIFSYGKEYNEFRIDKTAINAIEQRGWVILCQQLNLCDSSTAAKIIKMHLKEKDTLGLTQEDLQKVLFELATKKEIDIESGDYEKVKGVCEEKFRGFLVGLKLPKVAQKLKDYFGGLKNQASSQNPKKREELTVVNPSGEKEVWEIKE
jgi:hypothetical protein